MELLRAITIPPNEALDFKHPNDNPMLLFQFSPVDMGSYPGHYLV